MALEVSDVFGVAIELIIPNLAKKLTIVLKVQKTSKDIFAA